MQKERAIVQEHQSRNEGGHNWNAAGIQQGCSRERSTNDRGHSKYARGAQQEPIMAATATQQKRRGRSRNSAGIGQGCSRNSAKTNAWVYSRSRGNAAGPQQRTGAVRRGVILDNSIEA